MGPLGTLDRIQRIFEQAKAVREEDRAAFVLRECGNDPASAELVMSLLRADDNLGSFLAAPLTDFRGQTFGPYRALEIVGRGAMSVVYRGQRVDGDFEKRVAIKVVLAQWATSLSTREVQILAALEHPNIVRLLDAGVTPLGFRYLVMEFVDGGPLTRYARTLGQEARIRLFLQICAGVQHAHRSLIVHRDLKPDNILVTAEGEPKILDFGIAKILEPETGAGQPTVLMAFTLDYASPEQILGQPVTPISDVYSLGVILCEMLGGERPRSFEGLTLGQIVARVQQEEVIRLPVTGDVGAILGKALRRDPGERYESVGALRRDLERYLEGRPVEAREPTWSYRAGKFVRRHKVAVAATALAVAGLMGSTAVAVRQASLAEERFNQVRKLARSVMFDLHDSVRPLGGSLASRELIVVLSLEYLDALARSASPSAEVQLDLVRGYLRLGEIEGSGLDGAGLGRTASALRQVEKAVALARELNRRRPRDLAVRVALVEALWRHAGALLLAGDPKAMKRRAADAVTAADKLYSDVSSPDHAGHAAEAYFTLGMARAELGEMPQAVEAYRAGVKMAEVAAAGDPTNAKARKRLAGAYNHLCTGLYRGGDYAGAKEAASAALRIDRERLAADPRGAREDLASDLGMLAAVLGRLEQPRQAISLYGEQLELRRAVAADDPQDLTAKIRAAVSLNRLANAHRNVGDSREAIRYGRQALDTIQRLWRQDAENRYLLIEWVRFAVDLALSYEKAGWKREMCRVASDSRRLMKGPAAAVRDQVKRQQEAVDRMLNSCQGL